MNKKLLLSLFVFVCVISAFSLGAYAAVKYSLMINGKTVKADIKVINGTPYIPLPALSANLKGITVKHDPNTGTIKIDEPKPPAPLKTPAVGLSRSNPAPIGTTVTFTAKDYSDDYLATFKLEEIVRGDEAWKAIHATNEYTDAPADGYEYLLAKITVGVTKNAKIDSQVWIHDLSFTLVSSSGKDYPKVAVIEPDPKLDASLYQGASDSGWVALQVKIDDINPLLTYGRKYDGTGGVWLKTSN